MTTVDGSISLKSAESSITLKKENAQLIFHFDQWPKGLSLLRMKQMTNRLQPLDLEPIKVVYRDNYLATFEKGKLKGYHFLTALKVLWAYLTR